MKIGIVIPHHNPDRNGFLDLTLLQMAKQLRKPDMIEVIDYPYRGMVDIQERYVSGLSKCFANNCDVVLLIEDDDYYPITYIKEMVEHWGKLDKPALLGTDTCFYYHLPTGGYKIQNTTKHSSAHSTLVSKDAHYDVGAKNNPFYDIVLWNSNRGVLVSLTHYPISMKHGIDQAGGKGHETRYYRTFDDDRDILAKWVNDEDMLQNYYDIIEDLTDIPPMTLTTQEWNQLKLKINEKYK